MEPTKDKAETKTTTKRTWLENKAAKTRLRKQRGKQ